jgi:hypothetical protein
LIAFAAQRGMEHSITRRIDRREYHAGGRQMLSTILIVILILLLIGALPRWPYSAGWGYGPGGLLGTILIIVLILALLGQI